MSRVLFVGKHFDELKCTFLIAIKVSPNYVQFKYCNK